MTKHVIPRVMRGIIAVRAETPNVAAMIQSLGQDFESFKATMEASATDKDVLLTEKIDRIDASLTTTQAAVDAANTRQSDLQAALDQANATLAGIEMGAGSTDLDLNEDEVKYSATWNDWFRTGDGEQNIKAALKTGKIRAAASTVGVDADGGYTAPVEWDRTITDKLKEVSAMRQFASIQPVAGQGFKKLYNLRGVTSGWVGETSARAQTDSSNFGEYAFSFGEIYANPAATQAILEDSEIDFAAWLGDEVETEFAFQEGVAFVSGDGVNKPKGILQYTATIEAGLAANLRHPLGAIGEVNSGAAAALVDDGLVDLTNDLPSERMMGAAFYANRKTISTVRKMKDGQGNYMWQPSYQAGDPALILGYPVRELSGLPDVAANALPILFGNMERTYRIFDRRGVMVLRDPYTNKPYVHFYTTKRVGGGLWNPEWMRYHKVAL